MARRPLIRSIKGALPVYCTGTILFASACGSTVQHTESISTGAPTIDGNIFDNPTPGGSSSTNGPEFDANVIENDGLRVPPGHAGSTTGPSNRDLSSPDTLGNPNYTDAQLAKGGRGFTDQKIYIGYGTFESLDELRAQLGAKGGTNVSQQEIARAVAADINEHGGIADRRIELVFYDYETPDLVSNSAAAAQKACSRWTQDHPVFAAINTISFAAEGGGDEVLAFCMAQHQTPLWASFTPRPHSIYARTAPYVYSTSGATLERYTFALAQRLKTMEYFKGWNTTTGEHDRTRSVKVGVMSYRPQYGDEFRRLLDRELARQGLEIAAEAQYSGNASRASDEATQAVVRFRRAGVTHVIEQVVTTFFQQTAEQQNYRPRYAMSSVMSPETWTDYIPYEQLEGARGIGWIPTRDVRKSQDPGPSALGSHCLMIMKDSGLDMSSRVGQFLALSACEAFKFLDHAISRGGLSAELMANAAHEEGYIPASATFRVSFSGDRYDGADAVRELVFSTDCKCIKYASTANYSF